MPAKTLHLNTSGPFLAIFSPIYSLRFLFLQILTIAVLVILITAPIGAIAISLSAPRLLNKHSTPAASPVHRAEENDTDYSKYDQVLQV